MVEIDFFLFLFYLHRLPPSTLYPLQPHHTQPSQLWMTLRVSVPASPSTQRNAKLSFEPLLLKTTVGCLWRSSSPSAKSTLNLWCEHSKACGGLLRTLKYETLLKTLFCYCSPKKPMCKKFSHKDLGLLTNT